MLVSITSGLNLNVFAADDTIIIDHDMEQWDDTYENNTNIKKVIIEDGVLNFMTQKAFKGCTNLTDVVIGKNVASVPLSAFEGCTNLTNLTISGDTVISNMAFKGCTNIKKITYTGYNISSNSVSPSSYQPWYISKDSLETVILSDGIKTVNGSFTDCTKLKSVSFPDSLSDIGTSFNNCPLLTNISLPTMNLIRSAFINCPSITSVTIDTYTLDLGSFSNCDNLKDVTFKRIFELDGYCFHDDKSLKKFKVSSDVKNFTVIDGNLIYNKTTLHRYAPGKTDKTYTVPEGILTIDDYAFSGSPYIENVEFNISQEANSNATQIRSSAFVNCPNLKSITIPATVSSIGQNAIGYNCIKQGTEYEKSTSVTIKSSTGTAAETYAKNNNLTFVDLCANGHNYVYLDSQGKHLCLTCGASVWQSHSWDKGVITREATCSQEGVTTYTCTICNATKTTSIPKTTHTWDSGKVTKAATTSGAGTKTYTCSICGEIKTESIAKIASATLNTTATYYTGSVKTPTVTVKDGAGKTLVNGTDYTITQASGRINVGRYAVKITYKGNYSGTQTLYFNIIPKNVDGVENLLAKANGFTVYWNPQKTQVTGYQIQYSTSSNFSSYKTITMPKNTYSAKAVSGLAKNTKYYVRIRTYKTTTFNGANYNIYSPWCAVKNVSTITTTPKLNVTATYYNGKVKTPTVTVKDSKGKTLKKGTDYTVSYASGRKVVGRYAVKITYKGNYQYCPAQTLYFNIIPKNVSGVKKVTASKKGFTVSWNTQKTQTTGYQIQYSTSSKFTNAKTITMGKNTYSAKKVSGLTGGKKYYVRIRTYKTVKFNGKNYNIYSYWSTSKAITTKR